MDSTLTHTQAAKPENSLLQRLIDSDIPKSRFFKFLTTPYNPPAELSLGVTSQASEHALTMEPQTYTGRLTPETKPAMLPLYVPMGAWKWAGGLGIRACTNVVHLHNDKRYSMYFGTGTIGTQNIQFICKTWPLYEDFKEFTMELSLFKAQLKPLLGTYVPNVIGVYTGVGIANVLMELPHPAFWVEASSDMPDVLKKRCVESYAKLHAAGVLHGQPHPRNVLIGGDARVTIVNFADAKVLHPILPVNQEPATEAELRLEMRKVKYLLDHDNAREKERKKWTDFKARAAHNRAERHRSTLEQGYVPRLQEEPEENKLDPPVDLRKARTWADSKYESSQFIVPTISSEAYALAANKFIANIRRMEREGDGPPPSRSPSPPLPATEAIPITPIQPLTLHADLQPPIIEETPGTRRSLRKRKNKEDVGETPLAKRQKTTVEVVVPPPKPITVESFIVGPPISPFQLNNPLTVPTSPAGDPPVVSTHPAIRVRDFAYEPKAGPSPGPSCLRSALKTPIKPLLPQSSDGSDDPLSETARGKRKRVDLEDDVQALEEEESLSKRKKVTDDLFSSSPQGDKKRVSFAPAPDVFLKKYTIPPHLFCKISRAERARRRRLWLALQSGEDGNSDSDEPGFGHKNAETSATSLLSGYAFTFTSRPYQYVSHWVTDIFQSMHW